MPKSQLTLKDLQQLDHLRQTNREAMYRYYGELTDSTTAGLMADIASQEGIFGRFIKEASRKVKEKSDNPFERDWLGRIQRTNIGQFPKEGIEKLSQDIADNVYQAIKDNVQQGGGGILELEELLKADRRAWEQHGIGEFYPGSDLIGMWTLNSEYLSLGRMGSSIISFGASGSDALINLILEHETEGPIPTPDADDYYVPPYSYPEPTADNPPADGGAADSYGSGSLRTILTPLSSRFSEVKNAAMDANPFNQINRTYRSMKRAGVDPVDLLEFQAMNRRSRQTIDPEKLLGAVFEKNADKLIDKLIGRNPNLFEKTLGRTLATSLDTFAGAIRNSRTRGFEEAISNVFSGKGGQQFATNIGNMAAQEIVNYGINEIFYKERIRVIREETERSRNANQDFRLSRSQQGAELIRLMEKGKRNL